LHSKTIVSFCPGFNADPQEGIYTAGIKKGIRDLLKNLWRLLIISSFKRIVGEEFWEKLFI
jgi:hypothetical protein